MLSRTRALLVVYVVRKADCVLPTRFWFHTGYGHTAQGGRWHEGVSERPFGKWVLPLLSAADWVAELLREAQSSLCLLPVISPGCHIQSLEQVKCCLSARWQNRAEAPATS